MSPLDDDDMMSQSPLEKMLWFCSLRTALSKNCTVWEHSLSGPVWTKCPTRSDTQGARHGEAALCTPIFTIEWIYIRRKWIRTYLEHGMCVEQGSPGRVHNYYTASMYSRIFCIDVEAAWVITGGIFSAQKKYLCSRHLWVCLFALLATPMFR